MKRHFGLQPLSHDHHQGLVHASRMAKAGAGAERAKDPAAAADDYLAFYPAELVRHFQEEEEVLGPILVEKCGITDAQRARLFEEHVRIHALTRDLKEMRSNPSTTPEDLRPLLSILGETLERHIRWEERNLFPRLESLCTEEELMALPEHFHGANYYRSPSKDGE